MGDRDRDYERRDYDRDDRRSEYSRRDAPRRESEYRPGRYNPPCRRVYVGRLPRDCTKRDVEQYFGDYGRMDDIKILPGYAFLEFESLRDAEDVVHDFNGRSFLGERIIVEFAKIGRDEHMAARPRRTLVTQGRGGFRLVVSNLTDSCSWQDLKDFARAAGSVTFADVSKDRPGEGVIEYPTRGEADEALRRLDGAEFKGRRVQLTEEGATRRDDDPYTNGHGRDRETRRSLSPPSRRNGEDRDRDDGPRSPKRRDRSRSPRRSERERSPRGRRGSPEGRDERDDF